MDPLTFISALLHIFLGIIGIIISVLYVIPTQKWMHYLPNSTRFTAGAYPRRDSAPENVSTIIDPTLDSLVGLCWAGYIAIDLFTASVGGSLYWWDYFVIGAATMNVIAVLVRFGATDVEAILSETPRHRQENRPGPLP